MIINGIGVKFYGISKPDSKGEVVATRWIVFVYFPLIPLSRYVVKRAPTEPHIFQYEIIKKIPLSLSDVLKTYLFGLILTPALLFWPPILFAQKEVGEKLGYANENAGGTLYLVMGFAIMWVAVGVWKWMNYDEKKGLV